MYYHPFFKHLVTPYFYKLVTMRSQHLQILVLQYDLVGERHSHDYPVNEEELQLLKRKLRQQSITCGTIHRFSFVR